MPSKRIKQVMTGLFVLLWVGFASEMFLRVFDPQPMLPRYVQAGDFGIRVNMPNQTYVHTTPDYQVEIRTNNKGMRADRDYPYAKPTGVKRIVVLGDSFGMGYGVSFEQSFTEQMRRKLEKSLGQKVEVINLSVSGFGTAEELLMLRHKGIKYHPDLVLLEWHASDLKDNIRSGLFELKDGSLERKNASYLPAVKIREFLFSFSAYRWLAGNSQFYAWVRERAAVTSKSLLLKLNSKKSTPATAAASGAVAPDVPLALALLDQIRLTAKEAGAGMMVLEIPSRASRTKFLPSMPDEIRNRFDVVSPINVFKQHAGNLLYWERSEGHFTPLGCEIVAKRLAEQAAELLATQAGNSVGM